MKKMVLLGLCCLLTFYSFGEVINFDATDDSGKLKKIENELNDLKNEVKDLKEKSTLLDFKLSGSTKIIWGINFPDNPFASLFGLSSSKNPIHGFDFENNIQLNLGLNNNYIIRKNDDYDFSEVMFKFKMQNIKSIPYDYEPSSGDYYVVNAVDQDGNATQIYFPRNDEEDSDLVIGNYKLVLEQARLSNLLGTGFFINYADITNVDKYYGISPLVDVVKLNNEFFNHEFYGNDKELYYSFDATDFEPEAEEAEVVKIWSEDSLSSTQKPHGVSIGVDNDISDGFHLYLEGGGASKDGYDAEEDSDDQVDYGFFLRAEPVFYTDTFKFSPKINFGLAFQTNTVEDQDSGWSTLTLAFSLPLYFKLNDTDYISFEMNTNYKHHSVLTENAFMFTLKPEINILNNRFFMSMPIEYWYKDGEGGFAKLYDVENQILDQSAEEHIFNLGLITGFKSNKMYSDTFEYKLTNKAYFTVAYDEEAEIYLYDIIRNELNFYSVPFLGSYVLMDSFVLYTDIGFGLERNARYAEVKAVNVDADNVVYYRVPSDQRMESANVLYGEFGFIMNFTPYMSAGFSMNSPKVLINPSDTIGDQNTYLTAKIWSEIRL